MPENRHVGRPTNNPGRMEPRSVPVEKDKPRINDERKVKPQAAGQPPMGVRPAHPGAQKEPKAPADKLAGDYIQARDVPMQTMTEAELAEWNPFERFFKAKQPGYIPGHSVGYQVTRDGIDLYLLRDGKPAAHKRIDSHEAVSKKLQDLQTQMDQLKQQRRMLSINPRKLATKAAWDFAADQKVQPAKVGELGKEIPVIMGGMNSPAAASPAAAPSSAGPSTPGRAGHPFRRAMGINGSSGGSATPASGANTSAPKSSASDFSVGAPFRPSEAPKTKLGNRRPDWSATRPTSNRPAAAKPSFTNRPDQPEAPKPVETNGRDRFEDLGSHAPGPTEWKSLLRKAGYDEGKLAMMSPWQLERAFNNATSGMDRRRRKPAPTAMAAESIEEGYPDTNFEKCEPAHQSRIGDLGWKGRAKQASPPASNKAFIQARELHIEKVTEYAENEMDDMISRTINKLGLAEAMGGGPEVDHVTLPSYWASALVNGDFSGLEDEEADQCRMMQHQLATEGWHVVDVVRDENGEGHDARYTGSYQVHNPHSQYRGGDVLDYVVHRDRHGQEQDASAGHPVAPMAPMEESKLPRTRTRWI